jgi:site-specific DNA-methyltransferase (adenine-specific)
MSEDGPTRALVPLTPRVEGDASAALAAVYAKVPGVVMHVCERERRAMMADTIGHLRAVHDALAPYGCFKDWCDALGLPYSAVKQLLYRADTKQTGNGVLLAPLLDDDDALRLICADMRTVDLAPGSVDLIVTDPPYGDASAYHALGERAAVWLRPGGSLVALCGVATLPDRLAALAHALDYHWTLAIMQGSATRRFYAARVNEAWRPALWFTRGAYTGRWVRDAVTGSGRDKRLHAWGQDVGALAALVEMLSAPGALVCDPFVGAGSTAVAARLLGRRFVGIDVDAEAISTTRARLADLATPADA